MARMQPAEFYDRAYYETGAKSNYFGGYQDDEQFDRRAERIRAILPQLVRPRVLELGCAKGFSIRAMRDAGYDAYGVDWSSYAIASAPRSVRPYVLRAACFALPFANDVFDLVLSVDLLEHLDEPHARQTLREARRVGQMQLHVVTTSQLFPKMFTIDQSHVLRLPLRSWYTMAREEGVQPVFFREDGTI